MTGVGARSKSEQNQDGKDGIIVGENQKALALLGGYFRLVLAAAARRVFTRDFNRLMFFPCFRRIFRSFSRPRGIIPPNLNISTNKPRLYSTPCIGHTSNRGTVLSKLSRTSFHQHTLQDVQKGRYLTHPTPARQDVPVPNAAAGETNTAVVLSHPPNPEPAKTGSDPWVR